MFFNISNFFALSPKSLKNNIYKIVFYTYLSIADIITQSEKLALRKNRTISLLYNSFYKQQRNINYYLLTNIYHDCANI